VYGEFRQIIGRGHKRWRRFRRDRSCRKRLSTFGVGYMWLVELYVASLLEIGRAAYS